MARFSGVGDVLSICGAVIDGVYPFEPWPSVGEMPGFRVVRTG